MDPRAYLNVMGEVVGYFVDTFEPMTSMIVYHGNHMLITCSEISLKTTQTTTMVHIGGEHDTLYTLVMGNPDPPNPNEPSMRESVSWIVTNIIGGTSSAQGCCKDIGTHCLIIPRCKNPENYPYEYEVWLLQEAVNLALIYSLKD
ncbi:protein MOTHER of FT and TFL1-like [Bidens hawaiensis]|uniref:protein MOTHER of FT and TFL1-like n=1 Tax=Bidens hawaiensis TaxID=980011 RepID=UPI00404B1624